MAQRVAQHALTVVLSTLTIVLPIPRPLQQAHAQSALVQESGSFTFSDQSETATEAGAATASGNALKVRTSPIGSSGSYTRALTIRVPPGRNGMTPQLALQYSSAEARKASPVGAGWSFGVPSISRSTEDGFPKVTGGSAAVRYSNAGLFTGPSGRMAAISSNEGAPNATTMYSPVRQMSPVRYEFITSQDRWVEHLPSGVKRFYGASDHGTRSARIARIVNELGTHEWLLLKERDTDGNTIEYEYHFVEDTAHGQLRGNFVKGAWQAAQWKPILKGVRWGANEVSRTPHLFRLATQVTPVDGDLDMLNGHVMHAGLIDKISVFGPPVAGGAGEVSYWEYTLLREVSPETGRPLLKRVTESAPGLATPRVTTLTYSSNGDIYGARPGTAACNATAIASFGFHQPLAPDYKDMYRTGQSSASGSFVTPIEALSRSNFAGGYQFRDMDADGDADVAYLPAGLSAPVAQWLKHKSYVRQGEKWLPASGALNTSIPDSLLITEFGDVDGDVDPDAISFPLVSIPPDEVTNVTRSTRERAYHYTTEFITRNTAISNQGYRGVGLPAVAHDGTLLRAPPGAPVQIVPLNTQPACIPTRDGGIDFFSDEGLAPLMLQTPIVPIDASGFEGFTWEPILRPIGIPNPNDPNEGQPKYPNLPWFVRWDSPWPFRLPGHAPPKWYCIRPVADQTVDNFARAGHGAQTILIGQNNVRGVGGVRTATIDRWPVGVQKWVEPYLIPIEEGSHLSQVNFKTQTDFQAPAVDLNADGKADIFLIKLRAQFLLDGGTKTSFIPRAYISDGSNFTLDWLPPELVLGINLDSLFTLTNAQLRVLQIYRNQVRPNLAGVLPGTRVLPPAWASLLQPATRSAATSLLARYPEADAQNPARVVELSTALLKLFDDDLAKHTPRPVVSLRKLFERWNSQLWARAWDQPQSLVALVPTSLVPNIQVDLTDLIVPVNGPMAINLVDVVRAIPRGGFVVGSNAATTNFGPLFEFMSKTLVEALTEGLRPQEPPSQQYSSFSLSAQDILRAGREFDCNGSFLFQECEAYHAYPQHVNFNSLPLDINADGLPDLVVGARPIVLNSATRPDVTTTMCPRGHQVHLNRGYRWDTYAEWAKRDTAFEAWSSPAASMYFTTNKLDGTVFPLEILQNRSGSCNFDGSADWDLVDLALLDPDRDSADAMVTIEERLRDVARGGGLEWARTGNAAGSIKTSTLPMAAASFSDVNADGRVDLVFAAEVKRDNVANIHQLLFLNTGRGFKNVSGVENGTVNRVCALPQDFVMAQFDSATRKTVPIGDRSRLADVDGDGMLDLVYAGACPQQKLTHGNRPEHGDCKVATWRRNLGKVPDLLTTVEEPSGAWEDIAYVAATSATAQKVTIKRPGTLPSGLMVVSTILRGAQPTSLAWSNLFANAVERVDLRYDNYARETGSTQSLGFETVTAQFLNSESCARSSYLTTTCLWKDAVESTTTYDVRPTVAGTTVAHPLRGMVTSQTTRDLTTGHEKTTSTTYAAATVGGLSDRVVRIRPEQRIEAMTMGGITMYSGEHYSEPDDYGYPRRVVTGRADSTKVLTTHPETTTTILTYEHRPTEWRLGRPKSTTVEGVAIGLDGSAVRTTLSQSTVAYNAQGRVSSTSVLQDAGSECSGGRAQSSTTSFPKYNTAGLPETIVENTRTVEVSYDPANLYVTQRSITVPTSASSPGGKLEEELAYDPRHGRQRWHRDLNGGESTTTFDAVGRVLLQYGPDGSLLENNSYSDTQGGPWTVLSQRTIDPGKLSASISYLDGYGRTLLVNETAPAAGSTSGVVRRLYQHIDGYGRVTSSYQPRAVALLNTRGFDSTDRTTSYTFDGFDRQTSQTLPDNRRIAHAYSYRIGVTDPYLMVQTTNPRSFVTQRLYDSRGALVRVERLAGAGSNPIETFDYTRDGLGRITAVNDATGVRRVAYDVGGRLIAATLSHAATTPTTTATPHEYCFDADGQLVSALTPEGRDVIVQRDTLGRPQRVAVDFVRTENGSALASPTAGTFKYDCAEEEGSLGKLCERTDESGTTHYTYDAYGRQDSYEIELSPEITDTLPADISNSYRGDFTFGLVGQLKAAVYTGLGTGVHRIDYTHDAAGRTDTITVDDPRTLPRVLVKSASYDEFDRVVATTFGNNVLSTWAFDKPSQHLTSTKLQQLTNVFAEIKYPLANYDGNGNIGREERWYNNRKTSEKIHGYDALDRLTASSVMMDGFVRANEIFNFLGGNVTSAGARTAPARYDYQDNSNTQAVTRIASAGFERVLEYDADGWVSRDTQVDSREGRTTPEVTERELTFDAGGCLRKVESRKGPDGTTPLPTVTKNLCGLSGARVYRETTSPHGDVERVYYLPNGAEVRPDQDLLIMRLPVGKATVAHLAWSLSSGGIVPSESGYVHSDVRGSVISRTPLDAIDVRTLDRQAEYDAWGKTLAYDTAVLPRYQFTGEEPDPGSGYYFFGARAYDPTLRRWLSPDPLVIVKPDAGQIGDANLYAYAHNNPVVVVDRTGLLGDTPANWERTTETAMASMASEHPKEYLALGLVAVSSGLAVVLLPEAAAASLVGASTIMETTIDGVNLIVALVDLAQNPSLQSAAGVGIAAADLVGGMSPAGDANTGRVLSTGGGGGRPTVTVSASKHPQSAAHVKEAQAAGKPTTLTIDRAGAKQRRTESLAGTKPVSGKDRDEYPPAMFKEGGKGASVKPIPPGDNRGSGACTGNQCRSLPDGTQVDVEVVE